jgi:hypothetical protein
VDNIATFPPSCRICETFASLPGMELGKALKLMAAAMQGECLCGIGIAYHSALHPHASPMVGCLGAQEYTGPSRRLPLQRRVADGPA